MLVDPEREIYKALGLLEKTNMEPQSIKGTVILSGHGLDDIEIIKKTIKKTNTIIYPSLINILAYSGQIETLPHEAHPNVSSCRIIYGILQESVRDRKSVVSSVHTRVDRIR